MRAAAASLVLALALIPQSISGQERALERSGLPRAEVERLRAWIDDPASRHYTGDLKVADGQTVSGTVVVWQGSATIEGRVTGHVLVLEGDVRLAPGAEVAGDIVVVGGVVHGADDARLAGAVTAYSEGFGPAARDERRWARRADRDRAWVDDHWRAGFGDSDFAIRIGENYNRVEGLPVHFGPEIRTGGAAPTRIDAYAIWRTEVSSPFDTDRLGYLARLEQWLDRGGNVRLGATARSVVQPIERAHVTDVEASLATFLFRDDLRDYFERTGWSAYARVAPERFPLDLTVEYRDEDHETAAARTPWTLFGDDAWRPQPLAAEGSIRLLGATLDLDLRRDRDFAARGWRVVAGLQRRLDGTLTVPVAAADAGPDVVRFDEPFTVAELDLRRYQRAGPSSTLGVRVFGAGTLDERPLPPQFQRALGGAGSLPGYGTFDIDCGARARVVLRDDDGPERFHPRYGCDRTVLLQAEYRGGFDLRLGRRSDDRDAHDWAWELDDPAWIVFFDAARGWAYGATPDAPRIDTGNLFDAGLGILLGDFGVYGAIPLGDERDRGVKVFLRLGPRF